MTVNSGGWTCASALSRITQLRNEWETLGFDFTVELLDLFLAKKGGNQKELDMSKYCSLLAAQPRHINPLRSHTIHSFDQAKNCIVGTLALPDRDPATNKAFEAEWLKIDEAIRDLVNGKLDDLSDFQYAVGTGHFGYSNAELVIESSKIKGFECCCNITFKGELILRDRFAFHLGFLRQLVSEDYDAGAFLQKNCGYSAVLWSMKCKEERKTFWCPPGADLPLD